MNAFRRESEIGAAESPDFGSENAADYGILSSGREG
jgi:hypothetical protein